MAMQYEVPPSALARDDLTARLVSAAADVLAVRSVRLPEDYTGGAPESPPSSPPPTVAIYGRLRFDPERAYDLVAPRFRALGHVALLRRAGDEHLILALPGSLPAAPARPGLALALFCATLLSVLFVGAASEGMLASPLDLFTGWPFAASLLGILLAHELGHYVVARRLGVPATLPYFIPFPLSILGTLGAVIQLKGPPRNKRHLLAVAIAGPLAGLLVAVPVLLIGLRLSEVRPIPVGVPIFQEGNSLLYAGLKMLVFGRFLPSGGEDVFLHPVALAGWAGLLVTALNLIPAGQLDGGHVVHSLLGRRARVLTYLVVAALLALSLLWQGWLVWDALVFLFGRARLEPLDDVTPLRTPERALALLLVVVFFLVFTPIPMQ